MAKTMPKSEVKSGSSDGMGLAGEYRTFAKWAGTTYVRRCQSISDEDDGHTDLDQYFLTAVVGCDSRDARLPLWCLNESMVMARR